MNLMETFISQIDLFQNLDPKHIGILAGICIKKEYKKNDVVFLEGERGEAFYFCVTGNIQLYKSNPEGRKIVVKTIKAGESFAEVILFEKEYYPVSAVALRNSSLLYLQKRDFYTLLDNSEFRNNFIRMLIQKQRYLVDKIQLLSSQDVEDKLIHFIREQFGNKLTIYPKLSKKDVAAAIGTVPETLSRTLHRLKAEKKLIWEGDKITINSDWIKTIRKE